MMKHVLLVSLLFLATFKSYAQYDVNNVEEPKEAKFNWSTVKENLYVGGDINAILGNVGFIYFAPFIGYEFRAPFSVGVSGMVRYLSYGGGVNYFSKGGGVFARFKPRIPLVVESSFNMYSTSNIEPKGAHSWMLGVGYAQSMGNRSYTQIMIQYDLLNNDNVPENVLLQLPGGQRLYYKFGIVYYLGD